MEENLDEAIESLLNVEKQMRLVGDVAGMKKVVIDIVELCYKAGTWKTLNDQIVLLSKRRGQLKSKLRHQSAAVQFPIGLEEEFQGLVDLVEMKAYYFQGSNGTLAAQVAEKRRELIEVVSEVDDKLAKAFLSDEPIPTSDLKMAIRRATVACKFVPVYMVSAFKNKVLEV